MEAIEKLKKVTSKLKNLNKPTESSEEIKIGIVGIGSIGTPIAVLLSVNGYDVEITKKSNNALIVDNCMNLEINGEFGDRSYLVPFVQDNNFTSKKDVIIMCTQAFSTAGALKEVKKYLKPNGIVVSLQNVLNIEDVTKVIPKERYIPLVIDWTAKRIETNRVYVISKAGMHIGVLDEKAKVYLPIVKKLFDAIHPTTIEENMFSFIASRFILSCTLSSVIAITGYRLKTTLSNKVARKLIVGTVKEMLNVFEAYGVEVPPYCDTLDYYKFTAKGIKSALYRRKMFSRFIVKNGEMSSSVLRALENKKPTELDSMCARIVKMAEEKQLEVPFNSTIANFLSEVEKGNETIFMENLSNPCFTKLKIEWR